jgi:hypothetical protein
MKALLTGILTGVMLCGFVTAQSPVTTPSTQSTPGQGSSAPVRIAPGSVIPVGLTKTIDAKKVKVGDEVEARVTQDLKAEDGELIIAKDAKVVGHVTQAQARNKEQKESQVGIAFDHAVMKNGDDIRLSMSIQAIIAPPTLNANNNAGNESSEQSSSAQGPGGASTGGISGRSGGMGAGTASQPPAPPVAGDGPTSSSSGTNARPAITGNTQGVVGISNLNLSTATDTTQGSIVSSEKNNVKLESGTLMLLRVNQ